MKLQNLVAAATIGLTTLGASVAPALADSRDAYYTYNQHIGDVWVGTANIYANDTGGTTVTAKVNMPTCDRFSHLVGFINFSYRAEDGGYFNNYRFNVTGYEGYNNVTAFANIPHRMSANGTLVIKDETYCIGL